MIILLPILVPVLTGLLILKIDFKDKNKRKTYVMGLTALTAVITLVSNVMFFNTRCVIASFPFGIELSLKIDEISVIFSSLFAIIWTLVTKYSFEYMEHSGEENRFYTYFLASLGALIGVSYADNMVTLYMFFEIMSILSYVLVIHERTNASLLAGRKYIYYSLSGASMGLASIFYLYSTGLNTTFVAGGIQGLVVNDTTLLFMVIAIIGFGCKAGMFPLHGWLSTAHPIAPAPASSVLSGLITKAGVIAVIRISYYQIGAHNIIGTWAQDLIIYLAMLTIFMGSMLAYKEKILKKRLAYSTVSQVSYIILGLFIFNKIAFTGAILQVIYHAMAKNLLFLSAGTIIYKTGITTCDKLRGLGGSMKWLFVLYTIGGLSLVGIPLTGGFISKWYLAIGSLSANNFSIGFMGVVVIMISAVLTAGYMLSTTVMALFCKQSDMATEKLEISKSMMIPMVVLATGVLAFGIYPKIFIDFATNLANLVIL